MTKKASVPILWRVAIRESDLSSIARLVALVLSTHMDENGGNCFPSVSLLERETALSRPTVWKALSAIEQAGFIERKKRPGKVTVYLPLLGNHVTSELGNPVTSAGNHVTRRRKTGYPEVVHLDSSRGSSLSRKGKKQGKEAPPRKWTTG